MFAEKVERGFGRKLFGFVLVSGGAGGDAKAGASIEGVFIQPAASAFSSKTVHSISIRGLRQQPSSASSLDAQSLHEMIHNKLMSSNTYA
jgi:hypothetical protein